MGDKPGRFSRGEKSNRSIGRIAKIGIEMVVSKMSGKWKVGQNHPKENQSGII
jgi:predicted FMN-binding regulatory protein PaiB